MSHSLIAVRFLFGVLIGDVLRWELERRSGMLLPRVKIILDGRNFLTDGVFEELVRLEDTLWRFLV